MMEEIHYLQNMCLFSIQHHNAHVDTVRSRCYIPLHLNNDIYSCLVNRGENKLTIKEMTMGPALF
jgi:hypothetical protein